MAVEEGKGAPRNTETTNIIIIFLFISISKLN